MYIAGAPAVKCESRKCISLVCLSLNMSLGMYIVGMLAVGCESRDVYRWCAHSRMQVQGCISLLRPL